MLYHSTQSSCNENYLYSHLLCLSLHTLDQLKAWHINYSKSTSNAYFVVYCPQKMKIRVLRVLTHL